MVRIQLNQLAEKLLLAGFDVISDHPTGRLILTDHHGNMLSKVLDGTIDPRYYSLTQETG